MVNASPNGLTTKELLLELREDVRVIDKKVDDLINRQPAIEHRLDSMDRLHQWGAGLGMLILAGIALTWLG